MRDILYLTHRIPLPPNRGDKIRSCHILQMLRDIAPVHLASFAENSEDHKAVALLDDMTASHKVVSRNPSPMGAALRALPKGEAISRTAFYDRHIAQYVRDKLDSGTIAAMVVFSGQMAQYIPENCPVPVWMDFVDMDSAKFKSYAQTASPAMRWLYAREAEKLHQIEMETARKVAMSSFVSEAEKNHFLKNSGQLPQHKIIALGNGIDTQYYNPAGLGTNIFKGKNGPHLVFTGQMDYPPNVDAVCWFAQDILPKIRQSLPDCAFHIVGRNPVKQVEALAAKSGVYVTGSVPDVRPYIASADAVVAPLRVARGVQNKVLEAMAMARPVFVSEQAAIGIEADDGAHFCIIKEQDNFAEKLVQHLQEKERMAVMGQSARQLMLSQYGWTAQLQPLHLWVANSLAGAIKAA